LRDSDTRSRKSDLLGGNAGARLQSQRGAGRSGRCRIKPDLEAARLTGGQRKRHGQSGNRELAPGNNGGVDRDRRVPGIGDRDRLRGLFSYSEASEVYSRRVHLNRGYRSRTGLPGTHESRAATREQ